MTQTSACLVGHIDTQRRFLGVAMIGRAGIGMVSFGIDIPSQERANLVGEVSCRLAFFSGFVLRHILTLLVCSRSRCFRNSFPVLVYHSPGSLSRESGVVLVQWRCHRRFWNHAAQTMQRA